MHFFWKGQLTITLKSLYYQTRLHGVNSELHIELPLVTLEANLRSFVGNFLYTRGNLPVKWQRFRRASSNYEIMAQLKAPDNPNWNKERRTATLLTSIGSDALDVINAMEFQIEDERKGPAVILKKMGKYCFGEYIETYEKYVFNRRDQEMNESVDAYVTTLGRLVRTRNYGALTDSVTLYRIVVSINDNSASKKLLQTSSSP